MNLYSIQKGIQERQEELHRIAELLGRASARHGKLSAVARASTIALGAFVATSAVATKLWGENNTVVTIIYTLAGLVIATVSGLEAAFKVESRAASLRTLAAHCQTTLWQIDTEWRKSIGSPSSREGFTDEEEAERLVPAQSLLDRQDQVLGEVQTKAAELGENITFAVRQLYGLDLPATA